MSKNTGEYSASLTSVNSHSKYYQHVDENETQARKGLLLEEEQPDDDYGDVYCGVGSLRPIFLQPLAKITAFVGFVSIAGFFSSCLSVYISSQITTLERMFGFSSATSGVIMACNDMGYLLSILVASYFARRTHIPRVLFASTLLFGVSGLLCCIPYFLTNEKFRLSGATVQPSIHENSSSLESTISTHMCSPNETAFDIFTSETCRNDKPERQSVSSFGLTQSESTLAVVLIAVGMILQGFAKAPRGPFITTYIDDNAKKTKSPMYIGLVIGFGIFGPVVAFSLGGLFSRIYVTLEASDMSYRNPNWIGAWWLGFLVFGAAAVLLSMPLLFYPKHLLPKSERLDVESSKKKQSCKFVDLKGLVKTLCGLVTNPIYCPLVIAQVLYHVSIAGSVSFSAKYIETQFSLPAWKANIIMGACHALGASTGAMTGGKIISKFKISPRGCVQLMVVVHTFLALFNISFFFLGCPQQDVRADWTAVGVTYGSSLNDTSCLKGCFCDSSTFFPVCDVETGTTYYSPCHAGCATKDNRTFSDCSCVPSGEVQPGFCSTACSMLIPFVVVLFLSSFIGACTIMTFITTVMRSVKEVDKPFAVGVSAFMSNLIGWMPAPILYGAVIDTTCLIWNKKCDRAGSCAMYDTPDFRYKLYGLTYGFRLLSLVFKYIVLCNLSKMNFTRSMKVVQNNREGLNGVSVPHKSTEELEDKSKRSELKNGHDDNDVKEKKIPPKDMENTDENAAEGKNASKSSLVRENKLFQPQDEYNRSVDDFGNTEKHTAMTSDDVELKLLHNRSSGEYSPST